MSLEEWNDLNNECIRRKSKLLRYRYKGSAGHGTCSSVFKVWRIDVRELRVLKVFTDEHQGRNEIRILNLLQDRSEGIVRLYDVFELELQFNRPVFILELEFCDIGSLDPFIHRASVENVVNEAFILGIIHQICQTLIKIHAEGIIHRDLSPSNLLLTSSERKTSIQLENQQYCCVKVADLGVATALNGREHTIHAAGQPLYMSPEARRFLLGESEITCTTKADIYSLGKLILALTTGTPTPRSSVAHPSAESLAKEVPSQYYSSRLRSIVEKTLQYDPEQRPSAESLLEYMKNSKL